MVKDENIWLRFFPWVIGLALIFVILSIVAALSHPVEQVIVQCTDFKGKQIIGSQCLDIQYHENVDRFQSLSLMCAVVSFMLLIFGRIIEVKSWGGK